MTATPIKTAPISGQPMAATWFSMSEREAIIAGVRAADAALVRLGRIDVLQLFVRSTQLSFGEPKLEALRAYAELRRALLPQGRIVPATTLSAAGFTDGQIAQFDEAIASTPPTESKIE